VATLMLEGGADIRYVAEMLGHARLVSTQRYTRVSIDRLARSTPAAIRQPCIPIDMVTCSGSSR
jgi:site-specific recombinase XerD